MVSSRAGSRQRGSDQIIPKQFLKRVERTGFGEFLFYDWRRLPDGSPDPNFELNQPGYQVQLFCRRA